MKFAANLNLKGHQFFLLTLYNISVNSECNNRDLNNSMQIRGFRGVEMDIYKKPDKAGWVVGYKN